MNNNLNPPDNDVKVDAENNSDKKLLIKSKKKESTEREEVKLDHDDGDIQTYTSRSLSANISAFSGVWEELESNLKKGDISISMIS